MKKTMQKMLLALLMSCMSILSFAQQRTITGTVMDEQGSPLANVSYVLKGTATGGITNDEGSFSLPIKSNSSVIVFSLVGFTTQEVTVGTQTTLNIVLKKGDVQMEGVVVTALGMKKEQRRLGYASTTIKAEDLTNTGTPNFATALYGKAPGVRIGATPGGATSAVNITIRGLNSITGRTQPLIVVDGVPIRDGEVNNGNYWGDQRIRGNGLLDLNPEDIEELTVLKGASAAALYGSEALNGVLVVTTKSGKGRKGFGVEFNSNYSVDKVAYLPQYQNVRGPGAPLNVSNGGQDAEGFIYYDTDGDGVKETRGVLGYSINFGPKFDGKPTMAWDGVIRPYEAQTNSYDALFRPAHNSNVTVGVTQGGENGNMRFAFTRQNTQGVSLNSNNYKNVASLNSSMKLGSKVSLDLIVNYINQQISNRPYSVDRLTNNFGGMIGRFDNGEWYRNKYKTSLGYRYVTGTGQSLTPKENIIYNGMRGDLMDYMWRVNMMNEVERSDRVLGSFTSNWQIVSGLNLRGKIATDFTSLKTETKNRTEIPLAFGNSGYFGMGNNINNILYGDLFLTYQKQVIQDLEVSVMGGYTASKENYSSTSRGTSDGLSTENYFDIAASVNTPGSGSSRGSIVKDAFIGTLDFNYKNYLFLQGTGRRDRTSTMHPSNNAFFYPSVNASLVFTDAFDLKSDILSFGKIRASYGVVGGYPTMYQANIAYNQGSFGVQQTGGRPILYTTLPTSFGNDFIRPETKHEIELGLDMRFLRNRLSLEISAYNAQIRDQILGLSIPISTGASDILSNVGTLRNKGIEVSVKGTPVSNADFRWELGINAAKNQNKVEKLANNSTELLHADYDGNAAQLKSVVGQPMGDFYSHPVLKHANGGLVVDPNGMYKVDPDKMVKIGNAMPKLTGGFFNSLNYKGIALDFLMDFRWGGYVMPTAINWMTSRGLTEESLNFMDKEHGGLSYYESGGKRILTNSDKGPNGETVYHDGMILDGVKIDGSKNDYIASSADYYWTVYNWGGPQYSPNTRYELYIKENSYIKMREVTLGYTLPKNVSGAIKAKNITLSVFGRNLFYLYRTLKNLDAEQTTAGSRWTQTLTNVGTNPSTRTFGVMLRANF